MRSHLFRGVTFGTMLRDEAYHFIRLGTHLERADNTARILDVKYHILLPSAADVGRRGGLLPVGRAAALGVGLRVLPQDLQRRDHAARVAELLILRDDMPRSLHSCLNLIDDTLEILCDENSSELRRQAGELHARLHFGRTDDIIRFGLHEYLMDFLSGCRCWATRSAEHFLVPELLQMPPVNAARGVDCAVRLRIDSMLRRLRTLMTYCVAMSLDAGMIFASDSRTNAGVDQIARFSKMRVFAQEGERVIVTLSSGNLSITQNAINMLEHAARSGDSQLSMWNAESMFDVARAARRLRCAR